MCSKRIYCDFGRKQTLPPTSIIVCIILCVYCLGIICFLWSTGHISSLRLNDCILVDNGEDIHQVTSYHKQYLIEPNLMSKIEDSIMVSLNSNYIIIAFQEQPEQIMDIRTSSDSDVDSGTVQQQHKLILLTYDPQYSLVQVCRVVAYTNYAIGSQPGICNRLSTWSLPLKLIISRL